MEKYISQISHEHGFNSKQGKPGHSMHDFRKSGMILLSTFFLFCLVLMQPGSASVFLKDGTEVQKDQILDTIANNTGDQSGSRPSMQFFYDHDCHACQSALEYLRAFEKKNPDINITHYNLGYPKENQGLFNQYKARFNTTKITYPAVFRGDIVLSGSSDIIYYTEPLAKGYLKKGVSAPAS